MEGFSRRAVGYPLQVGEKPDIGFQWFPRRPFVEIGFLQEKTYGPYGFTCGNDRTDTEKEPLVRLAAAFHLRVRFGFSLLGSVYRSSWHRGCKIYRHEECEG